MKCTSLFRALANEELRMSSNQAHHMYVWILFSDGSHLRGYDLHLKVYT